MALDAATLALVARELKTSLGDARIDKIFEPTRDEVVLHLRMRTGAARLLLSARSGSARVCLTRETFENPPTPPSFCMLLRKHFTGGRLTDIRMIDGERIVFFDFACVNEMGDNVVNTIAAELMGRYSNIVLVQSGRIIDALKRVDFEDSDIRQLLPGLAYTLPPRPDRPLLMQAEPADIVREISQRGLPVAQALMKTCGGCCPALCREAAFRAFGARDVDADRMTEEESAALEAAIAQMQALWRDGGAPTAVVSEDGRPTEFSFLPLTQYEGGARLVAYDTYSELLEGYYAAKDKAERLRQKSKDLHKTVKSMHERAVRKLAARREEQQQSEASDGLRVFGELLSANLWAIRKGDKSATVTNYYDGSEVTIPLDVRLSPNENAQKYFKEYKKRRTAAKLLTELIAQSEHEIAYLESVLYEVESARGEAELGEIRAELKAQGYLKYYKVKDKKQKPADVLRYRSSDGFAILVGRNNAQNGKLTLKTARGRDLWFHVKDAPGSHVVVMSEGRDIPDTTRTEAAVLAALHSGGGAGGAKIAVDYTEVKNVWKANGAKPGMVLYDHYETAFVAPDESLAERLCEK